MKVLSIDTSTMISSCAVIEEGVVIGEMNINQQKTHSETLVPMIKDILDRLDLKPQDIDLYAVGKGPGSFTGLRIGMTTAKTMAQVFDKKIVGVSTLKALAYSVMTHKKIVALLDARGGRVYYGIYQWKDGVLNTVYKDELIYFEDLMNELSEEEFVFVGEGARLFKEEILKKNEVTVESLNSCIAKEIGLLAIEESESNNLQDPLTLAPEYIRKSQAQRDFEKKEENSDQRDGNPGFGRCN